MLRFTVSLLTLVVVLCTPNALEAQTVVNLDLQQAGDATHTIDDGILSSPGGFIWNGIDGTTPIIPLLDESNNLSSLSYAPGGGVHPQPSALGLVNTLQDSGFNNIGGVTTFFVSGFAPTDRIDVAIYLDIDTLIHLEHGAGTSIAQNFGTPPIGVLPGLPGRDYVIFSGLTARPGTNDLVFGPNGMHDGVVPGVQIRVTSIPEPTSAAVLICLTTGALAKRRRFIPRRHLRK